MPTPPSGEVAVIGVSDEKWGELIMALVVAEPSTGSGQAAATQADIIAHCREHLAGYKCPKKVEFRDSLERTATDKLQKFKLRQPFWEGTGKQVN